MSAAVRSRFIRPLVAAFMLIGSALTAAQETPPPAPPDTRPRGGTIAAALSAVRSHQPTTFVYFNRPIVVLRADVLGHPPTERAETARRVLEDLVDAGVTSPVSAQMFEGGALLSVGNRGVLVLAAPDANELAGETLDSVARTAVAHLRQALGEVDEAKAPSVLARSAGETFLVLVLAGLLLWALARLRRVLIGRLVNVAEQRVADAGIATLDTLRASRIFDIQRYAIAALITAVDLVIVYAAVTIALRRFPYTRPWGESMRGFLFATAEQLGLSIVAGLPGLFTVLVIFVIVRFIGRLLKIWFDAIEQGRTTLPGIYPDTARTTRRLVTTLLWLFAIVVAYPYMPGSGTDAFKGVSVFLGLMVTFGSSGLINQIVSGVMITYSRSLRVGDFVRVGDVEGTVSKLGVLSTKIETVWREVVTVPNAVVITQTATDYSRTGTADAVYTLITVTIGYDVPWRQVEAMLLMAAERTPGLRTEPVPLVYKTELNDFYVKYVLLVCLQHPHERPDVLNRLHAHILDLFNEFGVQIMSPSYRGDPSAPKVVPKKDWYAEPARRDDAPGNSRPPNPGSRGLSG